MMHWLAMGGYGRFLWPCYAATALVIALNIYFARRAFAAAVREARRRASVSRGDS
jgi:heme exporter protein CcmD